MTENSNSNDPAINDARLYAWQNRLLPWMVLLPTLLISAFIILATVQVNRFNNYVYKQDNSSVSNAIPSPMAATTDSSLARNMEYIKWYTLAKMEEESIQRRYDQGGVLLMSRIYTKYLGFFTGMILAIVGAVFIISKLKEDTSNVEGSISEQVKLKVVSSSPGVIFGILGTVLMLGSVFQHNDITVKDMPLYLNYYTLQQAQDKRSNTPPANKKATHTIREEDIKNLEDSSSR